LINIGMMVLEKKIWKFSVYFYSVAITITRITLSFIWTIFIPLLQGGFVPILVEIGPVVLEISNM
jgi:hypothetical protein